MGTVVVSRSPTDIETLLVYRSFELCLRGVSILYGRLFLDVASRLTCEFPAPGTPKEAKPFTSLPKITFIRGIVYMHDSQLDLEEFIF